jgi:hypothetical protein
MTGVHHVTVGDSERDPLLYLALGARAWITRIDAFLARYAPPQLGDDESDNDIHVPPPAMNDDRAARPATDDERAAEPVTDDVAVVLGVLAVRARILRALESTAEPAGAARRDAGADGRQPGWLR